MPFRTSGWRGFLWLVAVAAVAAALPEARALLTAGVLGGVVLGVAMIWMRNENGPRTPGRGTPIVLFPRPVSQVSEYSYLRG